MRLAPIALTALALTLSACEGGGDPVEQALRDAASENHAARVQDGTVSAPAHTGGHGTAGAATPGDAAFAASEAAMHTGMARASGETVDEAYIAKMIEHHRGAVAMAEVALRESRDPEVRRMAQIVVDTQTREIAEMQAWKPAPAN
ncbi:MAG: DUF305 domain-containing protein [Caulobacteraceae bacterium]|jgi:uncharacterized protein (DUF305 family)|nr:DUF305 domain-containing protein [Caulobacteraceae bacterium]